MSDSSLNLNRPVREIEDASLRIGRLPSPAREGSIKSLFSNLRDFLVERPVKVKAGTPTAFDVPRFGTGLGDNLKEFFHSGPRGNVRSALLVDWHEEPSLWANLRDWIAPRKLPPLKTTSQPIPVPEIWSKDPQFSRVQVVSILVHAVAIALVVLLPRPDLTASYQGLQPRAADRHQRLAVSAQARARSFQGGRRRRSSRQA